MALGLIINLAGLILIGFIIWWFWLSQPKTRRISADPIEIIVDGGVYSPARIEVVAGRPVRLRFLRKDPSPCAEKVLFDDFGLGRDLPIGRPVEIVLTPERAGEFDFTCQMKMYRGTLVVR